MTQRKFILISNDDGIDAPGIHALYHKVSRVADVVVVAPAEECSASSHAITLTQNLKVQPYKIDGKDVGYRVWGKPADCVKLALRKLLDRKPDLVISGINRGANTGISVIYSGTVGAAREAAISGVPAFAISITSPNVTDYTFAAKFSVKLMSFLFERADIELNTLLNVNVPCVPANEIKGVKFVKQAESYFKEEFVKVKNHTIGIDEYSLGGDMMVVADDNGDAKQIENKFVTITPLLLDMTDYQLNKKLENYEKHF